MQGYTFPVDLMELLFRGFDVILDMDCLTKHGAKIDFETKRLTLRVAGGLEIVVVGERPKLFSNVVPATKARKLMSKGCEAYLAYVINSGSNSLGVQDIRTVKDFANVFPEELLDLPPDQEVEFSIEVYPGITPISIAPYLMAMKELKELKIQ